METKKISFLAIFLMTGLLVGCSDSDVIPKGNPADQFNTKIRGYVTRSDVIVGPEHQPYWIQQAVSGYKKNSRDILPATVSILRGSNSCSFDKPTNEEYVGKVFVGGSNQKSSIYTFSNGQLSKSAVVYARALTNDKDDAKPQTNSGDDRMNIVDVVVTEIHQPVYLILTGQSKIIWNIHKSPKATISRVAVISTHDFGIANLDENVPVQMLYGNKLKSCKVVPVRKPAEHWSLVRWVKERGQDPEPLENSIDLYRKYSRWFGRNFFRLSEEQAIGELRVNHVLVGPLPLNKDDRPLYNPFSAATVRITDQDNLIVASHNEYKSQYKDMVMGITAKLSAGNAAKSGK